MSISTEKMQKWCEELIAKGGDFPALEQCLDAISTLDALGSLPSGTKVLVRGDTDVTFDEQGEPDDDSRLRALVDTLSFGQKRGWIQILYGHRGRDPKLSLEPVADYLRGLLTKAGLPDRPLPLVEDWMNNDTGEILPAAKEAVANAKPGDILLLQNTRKYTLEQALWKVKAPDLAPLLPKLVAYANGMRELASVHVNEGFAASNRDLSSTIVPAVMEHNALGAYIGNELRTHLRECRKAEVVIFSGMKLEKLDDLQAIINRGQTKDVIAAGLLAVALLKADADLAGKSFEMGIYGDSSHKLYIGPEWIEKCKSMLTKARGAGVEFTLPVDFILASGGASDTIPQGGAQLDVGPKTIALHQQKVTGFIDRNKQRPVVAFHNGVFGKFEEEQFAQGTKKFLGELKRMTEGGLKTYVGGGEGGAALHRYGDDSWVTHCFTAGGTILKALGTEPIPYLKALTMAARRK